MSSVSHWPLSFFLNSSYNELKIDIYRKKICTIQLFLLIYTEMTTNFRSIVNLNAFLLVVKIQNM